MDESTTHTSEDEIPDALKPMFWDCDIRHLSIKQHKSFIIRRLAGAGKWYAIVWLRKTFGDSTIAEWLRANRGGRLPPERLRFWQLVLDLPDDIVYQWVSEARGTQWERRVKH
ncbi:MAG: hypothetical protein HYX78_07180 [Armatimonadetes bacterium]|nr:hypothetical protein [Armatimonadota bacterium]